MRKRKAIVEHLFGEIKEALGFRRFTVNGLEGVRTQWSLLCTVLNLKKMYRWWKKGKLVLATRAPPTIDTPGHSIKESWPQLQRLGFSDAQRLTGFFL